MSVGGWTGEEGEEDTKSKEKGNEQGGEGREEREKEEEEGVTFSITILTIPTTGKRLYTVPTPYLEHVVRAEALVRAASLRVFRKCVQQYLVVPLRQQRKRQHTQQLPPISYFTWQS